MSISVEEKTRELRQNGFVIFKNFFSTEEASSAYKELIEWYNHDLEYRQLNNINEPHYDGPSGRTILTRPSHLMIDVYGKSPTLDKMVDRILTNPETSTILKELVGESIDFYGYNIRLMTGEYDPAPAHEWHIDSPGEMGIGILLTDVPTESDAATALVPGSHMYPYCPRWNTLFKNSCANYHSFSAFRKLLINLLPFNRILAKRINKLATGAFGSQGDFYYFINDTWHGRQPNLNGRQAMVVLIGGSSPDLKLHHEIRMPPSELLEDLPESIKNAFCNRNKPQKPEEKTIIKDMLASRQKAKFLSVFYWARVERKLFDKLYSINLHPILALKRIVRFLRNKATRKSIQV